jgi:hypothetical protein
VGVKDLEGELLIMPSKDVLPNIHQMIATAFLKNHMPLDRYQIAEHFQTAVNLTNARVGFAFLPASAKALFLMASCCERQIFLSDRWTRLPHGRAAIQTRSFIASSVYSRKSRRSCDSGLVARHKDVHVSPRFSVTSNGTGKTHHREAKAEYSSMSALSPMPSLTSGPTTGVRRLFSTV